MTLSTVSFPQMFNCEKQKSCGQTIWNCTVDLCKNVKHLIWFQTKIKLVNIEMNSFYSKRKESFLWNEVKSGRVLLHHLLQPKSKCKQHKKYKLVQMRTSKNWVISPLVAHYLVFPTVVLPLLGTVSGKWGRLQNGNSVHMKGVWRNVDIWKTFRTNGNTKFVCILNSPFKAFLSHQQLFPPIAMQMQEIRGTWEMKRTQDWSISNHGNAKSDHVKPKCTHRPHFIWRHFLH